LEISKGDRCVGTALHSCRTNLQEATLRGTQLQGAILLGAQLQGADLGYAKLQGADLGYAELQGANLQHAQLQGADLQHAELQGATLQHPQLQGVDLRHAQLQGTILAGAPLQGADFSGADLTLSNLQGLSQSPLDDTAYKKLKGILIPAIRDEQKRTAVLKRLEVAMRQGPPLHGAFADTVLCDDVSLFTSCLMQEKIAEYADARAAFLGTLGCDNSAIARGLLGLWHRNISLPWLTSQDRDDPLLRALAKHVTAIAEKDCPGWAALPAGLKDELRELAAEKTLVP
jgi:hypothetical protein